MSSIPEDRVSSRRLVMLALVVATVLASLDSSFVPIAFPDMIDDLDTSTGTVVWVALGYLIAATGPMLFLARIGDRVGYSSLFRVGTALYGLAMATCALAPDVRVLIGLRVVQGLGMALFLPATFSLASRVYPAAERGRALGVLASANAAGFIFGPVFAGWLLDSYDWRAIFYSRIPLAVLAILLAFVVLPRGLSTGREPTKATLDLRGAVFLSLSLFGLLFGLNRLPVEDNHLNLLVWLVFAMGLVFFLLFIGHERRHDSPLIDVDLYQRSPDFAKASVAFFTIFASFPVYLFILPLVLIGGLEFRAWDAGLLLAVVALITFLVSPWAGKLSDRVGAEIPCTAGACLVLLGYLALLRIQVDSTAAQILAPMTLFGLGTGLFFSPNNRLMMSSVPSAQAGMASGMIGTVRQAGYAMGFAVTASLFTVVQNRLELVWTRRGLQKIAPESAIELAQIFDEGGVWSPEVLVFILHLGAIVSAALLLLTLVYSLPRIRFSGRRHLAALGMAVVVAVLGIGLFVTAVGVAKPAQEVAMTEAHPKTAVPAIAPFGMAERGRRVVPAFAPPVLSSGYEVFVFYCSDCHGLDGRGVVERGVDLRSSAFLSSIGDSELVSYLREGRRQDDPRNRTGRAMPGMQTMPTFTDADYQRLVPYLRQLSP